MPEPITEVWRVSGGAKATEGIYESEEIARAQHSLNRPAGFRKASLERLPLATPEMVRVIGAAARVAAWEANADDDSAIRALSESNLSLGTLLHEVLMLSMAIDAARAAGGGAGMSGTKSLADLARLAGKMEEARDAARRLLGDRYEAVIGKIRRTLQAKDAENPLKAAIDLIDEQHTDGGAAVLVIVAAVDLAEHPGDARG